MESRLMRVTAAAALFLVGATWPLWWGSEFPQIPLFRFCVTAPDWCDRAAALVLLAALAGVLVIRSRRISRALWTVFLAAAIALVLLDQHRWQPWLWQFALLAVVFTAASPGRVGPLARILVISLYIHSAFSKLDRSFLETHGPQLVDGLLAHVGTALPERGVIRPVAAALLPMGELLVAGLLAFRKTRRAGMWGSFAMHAALMAALGPWGLNHKPGVHLWNAFFLVQNWLLFSGRSSNEPIAATSDRMTAANSAPSGCMQPVEYGAQSWIGRASHVVWKLLTARRILPGVTGFPLSDKLATLTVLFAALLPVLEPFGLLDPWLGWGLYASRPERLKMMVRASAIERLPSTLQPFVEPGATPWDEWRTVRLDRWSLATTNAPISPQVRFQSGVALAVTQAFPFNNDARFEHVSAADRWTGQRTHRGFWGPTLFRWDLETLWLNTGARR